MFLAQTPTHYRTNLKLFEPKSKHTTTMSRHRHHHQHHLKYNPVHTNGIRTFLLMMVAITVALANGQRADSVQGDSGQGDPLMTSASMPTSMSSTPVSHVQEIAVQPGSTVRLECKLPDMTKSKLRAYHWDFQRTATAGGKSDLLYAEEKNFFQIEDSGITLEMNNDTGSYDLNIQNVTYELNDGIYVCHYKDSSPESKQILNREFRLTVLLAPQPPSLVSSSSSSQPDAREGQEHQLICSTSGGNPEPTILWYRNDVPILNSLAASSSSSSASTASSSQQFRIEQLRNQTSTSSRLVWLASQADHQANFRCSVWNKAMQSQSPMERELRLRVEYSPRISVGPHNPMRALQGHQVTLSCLVDANPPVKNIRWLKEGLFLSSLYNLTVHEVKLFDAGLYTCQADNGIGPLLAPIAPVVATPNSIMSLFFGSSSSGSGDSPAPKSASAVEAHLQLQVLYAPVVQVKPARHLGTNPSALNEGDPFGLNCSVDASPPPYEFVWTRAEDPNFRLVQPTPYLEFASLSAADMGNYTCTAHNRLEPSVAPPGGPVAPSERQGSASAMLMVRHKPGVADIVLGANGETEQGARTLIQCRARPPGYPEVRYQFWRLQNNQRHPLTKATTSSTYTIHSAKADDEARYGCSAHNELGVSSEAEGELLVNDAPKVFFDTKLAPEDQRHPGDSPFSIAFRATGKPQPRVAWFYRSAVDGRRVEITGASALAGPLADKFKVDVYSTAIPSKGNPARPAYSVVSTLTFKQPLSVDDRGLYSVEFANGIGAPASENYQLHIYHSPVPVALTSSGSFKALGAPAASTANSNSNSNAPATATAKTRATYQPGEQVNLTCRVSAWPKPEFQWWDTAGESTASSASMSKNIEASSRFRTSVVLLRDDIWQSSLTFAQANQQDHGDYMCVAANRDPIKNELGESVRTFVSLDARDKPDRPSQLEAPEVTQDSVSLQWLPGTDASQSMDEFVVQYAPDDASGSSLSRRFPKSSELLGSSLTYRTSSSSSHHPNGNNHLDSSMMAASIASQSSASASQSNSAGSGWPKFERCYPMSPCVISGLQSRQSYVFRVRAVNELGHSEFSDELRLTTKTNLSQIPRIADASYDPAKAKLHFVVEPNSDYQMSSLNVKVETKSLAVASSRAAPVNNSLEQQQQQHFSSFQEQQQMLMQEAPWRLHSNSELRNERGEVTMAMAPSVDQLRLTLCSRFNESLCGPDYVISLQSATAAFLQYQRGASFTIVLSMVTLVLLLGAFATTLNSCFSARKPKLVDTIQHHHSHHQHHNNLASQHHSLDNKPIGSTSSSANNGSSTGSTASTNANCLMPSMDSINNGHNGHTSDHSSDHSRQAKLDSLVPPNYSHYADRATILMERERERQEQQHHQNMHLYQQQQALNAELGTLLGAQGGASQLLGVAQNSPGLAGMGMAPSFAFDHMSQHQHQHQLDGLMMAAGGIQMGEPNELHHHQHLSGWPANASGSLQPADPSADFNDQYATFAAMKEQHQQQSLEPAYATSHGLVMASSQQQQNGFDAGAKSSHFQSYLNDCQDSSQQYQQQQQHQMYATLNGFGHPQPLGADLASLDPNQASLGADQPAGNAFAAPNGLGQAPQESDYGTIGGGGRGSRLIREIIV